MSAYVIANVKVTDPTRYAEYVKLTPPSIVPFGGRFLARGGPAENLEGATEANRVVILEFDSYERARDWYESEGYRVAKALRQSASVSSLILVDGVKG
ncbi:MAG: DUF1330 domain-containing protein [Steroidobacteraceae bacterium]